MATSNSSQKAGIKSYVYIPGLGNFPTSNTFSTPLPVSSPSSVYVPGLGNVPTSNKPSTPLPGIGNVPKTTTSTPKNFVTGGGGGGGGGSSGSSSSPSPVTAGQQQALDRVASGTELTPVDVFNLQKTAQQQGYGSFMGGKVAGEGDILRMLNNSQTTSSQSSSQSTSSVYVPGLGNVPTGNQLTESNRILLPRKDYLSQINYLLPSSIITKPTWGEKIRGDIRRSTGISIPSASQAYRDLFRGDQSLFDQSAPIDPWSVTKDVSSEVAFGVPKKVGATVGIVFGVNSINDRTRPPIKITTSLPYQTRGTSFYNPETGYQSATTTQTIQIEPSSISVPGTVEILSSINPISVGAATVYGGTQITEGGIGLLFPKVSENKADDLKKIFFGGLMIAPAAIVGGSYAFGKKLYPGLKPVPREFPQRVDIFSSEEGILGRIKSHVEIPAQEGVVQRRVGKWLGVEKNKVTNVLGLAPEKVIISKPRTINRVDLFKVNKDDLYMSYGGQKRVGAKLVKVDANMGKLQEIPTTRQPSTFRSPFDYTAKGLPIRELPEEVQSFIAINRPLSKARIGTGKIDLFKSTQNTPNKDFPFSYSYGRTRPIELLPKESEMYIPKARPIDEEMIKLYHGTSSKYSDDILGSGLKPAKSTGIYQGIVNPPEFVSTGESLDIAKGFVARTAIKTGSKPSVFEINIPKAKFDELAIKNANPSGTGEVRLKEVPKENIKLFEPQKISPISITESPPENIQLFVGESSTKTSSSLNPIRTGKRHYAQQLIKVTQMPEADNGIDILLGGRAKQLTKTQLQNVASKGSAIAAQLRVKIPSIRTPKVTPKMQLDLGLQSNMAYPLMVGGTTSSVSAYAGKGMYEQTSGMALPIFGKLDSSLTKSNTDVKLFDVTSTSIMQTPKVINLSGSGLRTDTSLFSRESQVQKTPQLSFEKPAQQTRQPQIQIQRMAQKTLQMQIPKEKYGQRLFNPQIQRTRNPEVPRVRINPPIIIPKLIRNPKRNMPKRIRRGVEGFIPELRRRGKFVSIGKPTSFEQALGIGKTAARQSLGASIRLRKISGGYASLTPSQEFRFGKNGRESSVLVQKAPFRLSSRGERFEILRSRKGGNFL